MKGMIAVRRELARLEKTLTYDSWNAGVKAGARQALAWILEDNVMSPSDILPGGKAGKKHSRRGKNR
jgi:hypothetical protein